MPWDVEYTDQFEEWWNALDAQAQEDIDTIVHIQSGGRPLRVLYAFAPRRTAILLIGGDKTGNSDAEFYGTYIPLADRLYEEHLATIEREEKERGKEVC